MNNYSNHIISDILEINQDIVNKRNESVKKHKIIGTIKDKYYRFRLDKSIKSMKKHNLMLDKMNLQDLFIYILTYYDGKYKSIEKITDTNLADDNVISVSLVLPSEDPEINNIRYYLTINNKENMEVKTYISSVSGSVDQVLQKIPNLYYDDKKDILSTPFILSGSLLNAVVPK